MPHAILRRDAPEQHTETTRRKSYDSAFQDKLLVFVHPERWGAARRNVWSVSGLHVYHLANAHVSLIGEQWSTE